MECPTCGHENLPGSDNCDECLTSLMHEDVPEARVTNELERSLLEEKVEALEPQRWIGVDQDEPLETAIRLLRDENIGCVVVTDSGGLLSGIFSERDVLNKIAGCEVDTSRAPVQDFMTRSPETVRRDHPLSHALQLMTVGGYRHLPLADEDGLPTGMISSRDIVDYIEANTRGV